MSRTGVRYASQMAARHSYIQKGWKSFPKILLTSKLASFQVFVSRYFQFGECCVLWKVAGVLSFRRAMSSTWKLPELC